MTQPLRNSNFIQYMAPQAIIDVLNKIKPKSSSGQDKILAKLMKTKITTITHSIDQSLQTDIVPDEMKIAKVVPKSKASNQSLVKKLYPN